LTSSGGSLALAFVMFVKIGFVLRDFLLSDPKPIVARRQQSNESQLGFCVSYKKLRGDESKSLAGCSLLRMAGISVYHPQPKYRIGRGLRILGA
jgi:hypothetical protein